MVENHQSQNVQLTETQNYIYCLLQIIITNQKSQHYIVHILGYCQHISQQKKILHSQNWINVSWKIICICWLAFGLICILPNSKNLKQVRYRLQNYPLLKRWMRKINRKEQKKIHIHHSGAFVLHNEYLTLKD